MISLAIANIFVELFADYANYVTVVACEPCGLSHDAEFHTSKVVIGLSTTG